MDYSYFRLCFILCLIYIVNGQDPPCTGRDQCSCVTNDGRKHNDESRVYETTLPLSDIDGSNGHHYESVFKTGRS